MPCDAPWMRVREIGPKQGRGRAARAMIACCLLLAISFAWPGPSEASAAEQRSNAMAMPQFSSSGIPDRQTQELVKIFKDASKRVREMVLHPTGTPSGQEFRRGRAA